WTTEPVRDRPDCRIVEVPPRAERAVRLEHDAAFLAGIEQPSTELERAELHLIDRGRDGAVRDHLFNLARTEVRHSDRARVTQLAGPLHSRPRPRRSASRPVDDVEVDVIEAEAMQAALHLSGGITPRWMELRGDEHVLARDAAFAEPLAHAFLVPVSL